MSTIGYLTRKHRWEGLAITLDPHAVGGSGLPDRLGSVQFEMFGRDRGEFLNYVRSIGVASDGRKWTFQSSGKPQPFEDQERYSAKKVRDRFTSEMVEAYCRASGVEALDEHAYGPMAVLICYAGQILRADIEYDARTDAKLAWGNTR